MEAASGKTILIIRDERDVADLLAFNLRFCQKIADVSIKIRVLRKGPRPGRSLTEGNEGSEDEERSQGKRYLCILAPPAELVYFRSATGWTRCGKLDARFLDLRCPVFEVRWRQPNLSANGEIFFSAFVMLCRCRRAAGQGGRRSAATF